MGKWSTTHNIPSFRKTTTPFNAIELQMEGWTGGRDKVDCTKDWGREWHYWHYTYSAGWCLGPQNYLKSKVQDDVHLLDMQRGWCWGGQPGPWDVASTRDAAGWRSPHHEWTTPQKSPHTPWLREKHLTSSKPKSTFESTCAWQSAVAAELSLLVGERFEEEGPSFRQQRLFDSTALRNVAEGSQHILSSRI